jgi:cytochrome c biogenesis protein CcmG/thiol:disulfide interchange protein DsbE
MNRWLAFLPLAVLVLVVIAGAVLLMQPARHQTTFSTPLVGQAAPTYDLPRLGGGDAVTSANRPQGAYVINMFASWCTPCRAEHDQLLALQAAGVTIVGVAYKNEPADASAFLNELGNPYSAVALDRDGRFGIDFGLIGVPETYVIGADGRVKLAYRNPLTPEVVRQQVLPALRAP